jgi:hypothetical protein
MPDHDSQTDVNFAARALLYANGELDGPQAAAFEQELEQAQAARDALCQAVQLTQTLGGLQALAPDPAYRDRVRDQLADRAAIASLHWWQRLVKPQPYRGHPAAWVLMGALAASLVILTWQPNSLPAPAPANHSVVALPAPEPEPAAEENTGKMARVWAELHTPDHLDQVREEEQRRKHREEERRLAHRGGRLLRKPGG